MTQGTIVRLFAFAALAPAVVLAHGGHHHAPSNPAEPIDTTLKLHMILQSFIWAILFPLTMILGLIRHRLHVPLATLSMALTILGYLLGRNHGGRTFPRSAHGTVASILVFYLIAQTTLGIYLKLHLKWRGETNIRPTVLFFHGLLGKTFPLIGWVQMVLGITTLQSWCYGGHLGQCLAHYIMGSSFIAYSVLLLIMMKAGAGWLARRGKSQEWFDSWVICLWGLVNTFTEHHGGPWTHKDLQHTTMGVVWFFGGAVGIWTSRKGRRTIFPGVIIVITGWAMSGHAQKLMLSTMVHGLFGYALMAAGVARIIEVCFVLQDRPTGENDSSPDPNSTHPPHQAPTMHDAPRTASVLSGRSDWTPVRAFQYFPPWLLTASGVLFMSATDEELKWADGRGVDHITWGLIDFSIAFALFFWFNVLLELYTTSGGRFGCRDGGSNTSSRTERGENRSWYSRLSLGGNRTGHDESMSMNPLSRQQNGGPSSSNGSDSARTAINGGHRNKDQNEAYSDTDEETHVLFDDEDQEGEEDAKSTHVEQEDADPFDDRRR
ncbi:unnamed protein product [Sympodiomycopsis kandeliae]